MRTLAFASDTYMAFCDMPDLIAFLQRQMKNRNSFRESSQPCKDTLKRGERSDKELGNTTKLASI
jgi:hypothetical protein